MKTKYKFVSESTLLLALALFASPLQAGSLWRESVTEERGMFADKRARRVGDILTVVLAKEKIDLSERVARSEGRTTAVTNPGLGTNLLNQVIGGLSNLNKKAGSERKFPGNLLPRENDPVKKFIDPNRTTNQEMDDTQLQKLDIKETQIAVQVIDVLPNGNMVVEGIRQIAMPGQVVSMSLRGIVRAMDVTAQNTVPASLVADARIEFMPQGPNTAAFQKGWMQKVDEKITPW